MKENVEEAIDRLEYVNRAYDCNNYYSRYDLDCIQILLSDYKRVLKINEVLLKENEELKNKIMEKELEIIGKEEDTKASMGEIIEQYYTANEDCIAKQRIEDIIDRIDYDIKKTKEIISNNSNIYTSDRRNNYQE